MPLLVAILALAVAREASSARAELPVLAKESATDRAALGRYLDELLRADSLSAQLLNESNQELYREGYRPTVGVWRNPESGGRIPTLKEYFLAKLFLDLSAVAPVQLRTFEVFVDQLGKESDKTLTCAGEFATKYDLDVEGSFIFSVELAKVPNGPERELFKRCWLNDFVLGTELRVFSLLYQQFFGVPYVNPEKRNW